MRPHELAFYYFVGVAALMFGAAAASQWGRAAILALVVGFVAIGVWIG